MRKQASNPYQTSFGVDLHAAAMPHRESDDLLVKEADAFTISVPEHVPVFTVTLKRSDVISLQSRTVIRSPGDAAAIFRDRLKEVDRDQLIVMMLDTKLSVIGLNTVSIGILDSSLVHPREVFKPASIANAASIILAHNHPSGDPMPSQEDRRVTERLVKAGHLMGIEVLDHVIIGDLERFASMKEKGMM